ncbi:MAG: DUF2511 domain-containing protein [Flavobacterium sp.]|nr:DUF2511 domain-containing protein [Flavobacterium sp.]
MKKFLLFGFAALVLSCSPDRNGIKITKQDYTGKWPFTVNEVEVWCDGYKEIYMEADNGKTYALSVSAKTASKDKNKIYNVDEIWLDNPDQPGTKLPYTDFIERGIVLCNSEQAQPTE